MGHSFYLRTGKQTKITKLITSVSTNFNSKGLYLIFEIFNWMKRNLRLEENVLYKNRYFRKRTANEIIQSGFTTGCTDYALVFLAMARNSGIPSKYVETVKTEWLDIGKLSHIEGHVFCEIFVKNRWFVVDPQSACIRADYPKNCVIVAAGLDSWDIDIKNLHSLKKKFMKFKEKYIKEKTLLEKEPMQELAIGS